MEAFEAELQEATTSKVLPTVLLAAANKDGSLNYFKPFGYVDFEKRSHPASAESVVCLASATKLVTCVAAMQVVERGLIGLDDDITKSLPEWKDAMILKGFREGDGSPILEKAQNTITLRHLLSHTSGITGLENEQLMKYYSVLGEPKGTLIPRLIASWDSDPDTKAKVLAEIQEVMGSLAVDPLVFEPGSEWSYGQGTDWAGQLVERLTHMTLEQYCQENIFKPLGMAHTTYRLLDHLDIRSNLVEMTSRNPDGTIERSESIYPLDPKVDMGGSNLYTSGPDMLKVLTSLLRNDGKVLRPETADLMFDYRLPNTDEFSKFRADPEHHYLFGDTIPEGMQVDHCLAGLVNMQDLKAKRRAGSVTWMGATWCYWWIDREAGLCGFYGSQIMVLSERQTTPQFVQKFERAIYEQHGTAK